MRVRRPVEVKKGAVIAPDDDRALEFYMTTMNKMVNAVRTVTRRPAWARTAEGIVRRWEEHHDNPRSLDTLHLGDRLQRLFVIGCYRSAQVEEGGRSRRGNNPVRNALSAGERLADGERPAGFLLDSLTALESGLTRRAGYLKLVTLHLTSRLVMPDHRLMGTRRDRVEMDVAITQLLARLAGVRALQGRGRKMRRSERF